MGIFSKPFNPDEHRSEGMEQQDDPVLSKGYYACILVDTKEAEDGRWFLFKWQVTQGPAKGTKVSVFDNPTHKDGGEKAKQADRIFRGRLANYCDAVGLKTITDESELLNRPVKVHFKPWVRNDGTAVNQVSHYRAINDTTAPLSTAKPRYPTATAAATATAASEWHQAAAEADAGSVPSSPPDAGAEDFDDEVPF